MGRPHRPDSHPICPTCESPLPQDKQLEYLAQGTAFPPTNDDVVKLHEESSRLVFFLGAVAQAGPLAVAHAMEETSGAPDWLDDFVRLVQELVTETQRRVLLLRDAGRLWQSRAEQEG